ncbi:TcfC E-set like domain-containing protein [Klebsiella sp. S69]|uniref:TcfC E-set like domain-containing protein n=1 Tax=Klebsiella sp. S69 TaxID=2767439 RepID=UPI0019057876|nr:TcfC E-set like domain-containing protein [Klebsiella sp. S69]MBK0167385.1 TcfC E-set like domain-containing protein [Klebsiella sp. S69]
MDKPNYIKNLFTIGFIIVSHQSFATNSAIPVRVNNYVIPAVFAKALQEGMTIPVFIRYDGQVNSNRSNQKIAEATISVRNEKFLINSISLDDLPDRIELTSKTKKPLEDLHDAVLNENNRLYINNDASIRLEVNSLYLELVVKKSAMEASILPRTNILGESTVEHVSSILNYSIGSYYNKYNNSNNGSSYVTLDNTTSVREHHFNINGTIYGIGTSNKNSELYRAMYERDYQGNRLALGMVDTWNLQSIASMSALNSSRIYGVSYGNKSSTFIEDNTLTLIPITVFLPAAGQVHVIREGRLLSIQDFSMGSYEIDTSKLPFGIYSVDVDVVVNGKVVSSRVAQINKTFSRDSSVIDNISWQFFSGALEYDKMDYRRKRNVNKGTKDTWIAGGAIGTSKPWFSGVNLKSTVYGFDNNGVNESEVNVVFNDSVSLNQQALFASDSSWQSISTLNFSIPGGYGSFWGSRQLSHIGNNLPLRKGDYLSIGANSNLNRFSPWLGNISISRTDDKYNGSKYTNIDYGQTLFSGRWATISLRTGIQRYYYSERDSRRDKYINLDFSLPLSAWFSTGVSSENGNVLANATIRKNFDDSLITQVGTSISKKIHSAKDNNGYQSEDFAVNSYASYDAKYNAGTVSVTRSSDHNSNISLNSQGSIGLTKESFNLGKGSQSSGIVIKTDFTEKGRMLAQINGVNYPLSGKSNFISLPPYAEYKVELMNDKTSEDSVDIVSGRRSKVVLYPGNIGLINPEVKQLVTVFGRILNSNGQIYSSIEIHNHIGKTRTDKRGEFAMDVDKRFPVITLVDEKGSVCEADLDLREARGAIWLGDIKCIPQTKIALRGDNYNVY